MDTHLWTVAFYHVKEALTNASLLVHPTADAPTSMVTDAFDVAVGAVVQQYLNGHWCPLALFSWGLPLALFSRGLTPTETRYSTYDRELLAIYLAIKHFRYCIKGRDFHIEIDH